MAWTSPATWTAGQVVSAADMNTQVRDNMSYLLSGRPIATATRQAQYSTTTASFTDVDATNLKVSGSIISGRAMVLISTGLGAANSANHYGAVSVIADSTTYPLTHNTTYGLAFASQNDVQKTVGLLAIFTGLSAGTHDFKLQFKAGVAGQAAYVGSIAVTFAQVTTMALWEA